MKERFDLTPAALYARVSSDRQDVDLSVSAQLRALRDYAEKNGYLVAREYVDEAESGRIADRPQFQKMLNEASKSEAPFQEILVWKFSRFTRKREHAVAFKAMLRRRGVRVVSITEHADDSPTGKLLEAIIESVDEFYSENLIPVVHRNKLIHWHSQRDLEVVSPSMVTPSSRSSNTSRRPSSARSSRLPTIFPAHSTMFSIRMRSRPAPSAESGTRPA